MNDPDPRLDPDSYPDTGPDPLGEAPVPVIRRVRRRRTTQRRARRRRVGRRFAVGGGLAVVVLGGLGAWLGFTAHQAEGELEVARDAAAGARAALLDGDPATATREVDRAGEAAGAASDATSSLPWDLVTAVPVLGDPFVAARELTLTVDQLAEQVLRPAVQAGAALSPEQLRPAGAQLDLAVLASARQPLGQAAAASVAVADRAAAIPDAGWLSRVDDAQVQLSQQTRELADLLRDTDTAATLVPPMLGANGPRSYFLGFQTNAEARGTGGLLGGFGILQATQGALGFDALSANNDLVDEDTAAVDLGQDYTDTYGGYTPTGIWGNSNLSSHFPYAARAWQAMWQRQSGQTVDGAVATDPVALSYILGATGPVTLAGGEVVSADNVVALTEVEAYARFPADRNAERKAFLQEIAQAVVGQVTSGAGSTTELLRALGRAAGEGRLAVWSADPGEQQVLAGTPLAGVVPDDDAPYAGVTVNNFSNGKLDYYLGRSISYTAGGCSGQLRESTVTVTLTNNAPASGLPTYVTNQRTDFPPGPTGTNTVNLQLLATSGALVRGVTVDGVPTTFTSTTERGHPALGTVVQLLPGQTRTVVYDIVEPTSAQGAARVPVQPLVLPAEVTVDVPSCTTSTQ